MMFMMDVVLVMLVVSRDVVDHMFDDSYDYPCLILSHYLSLQCPVLFYISPHDVDRN